MLKHAILTIFLFLSLPFFVYADDEKYKKPINSFSFDGAKKRLYELVPYTEEFYCGCPLSKGVIDFKHCDFKPDRKSARSFRTEAEHVVPASEFGRIFKEYRLGDKRCRNSKGVLYSGRQCLLKISKEYRMMHNDLYNLKPAIGLVNGDRSNIPYGELPNVKDRYQGCDFKWTKELVEPRNVIKGNIARGYLYMVRTYERLKVDGKFLQMLLVWSNLDPVDNQECITEKAISKIQGNRNRFVCEKCKSGCS